VIIQCVSTAADGTWGNFHSFGSSVSADGRYVAFSSMAWDSDVNYDMFVKDRLTGEVWRVSTAADGTSVSSYPGCLDPSISADGRYVAFETGWDTEVYVSDRLRGEVSRASIAADGGEIGGGANPCLSADGRYVVFQSQGKILLKDLQNSDLLPVSIAADGTPANGHNENATVSADGRYVAFRSYASNLVPGDTNDVSDILVKDRLTGEVWRASSASDGSGANDHSDNPAISADGRFIAFESAASNLVSGDTNGCVDIFVADRVTGEIRRASTSADGMEADAACTQPALTADGRYLAFVSDASNLVPHATNGGTDIFVKDLVSGEIRCVLK
jgi:Tol biopolymer transport system component